MTPGQKALVHDLRSDLANATLDLNVAEAMLRGEWPSWEPEMIERQVSVHGAVPPGYVEVVINDCNGKRKATYIHPCKGHLARK